MNMTRQGLQKTSAIPVRLRQPHQIALVLCVCVLIAGCDLIGPDEGTLDADAIPGDYSAIYASLELDVFSGDLITPDPANVFDLVFAADGSFSGRITFTEPITDRFADLVWGGPPPFDAAVSGAWEIRDDRMHLGDANIDFLNLLVFEDNGSVSINEFGITPNGELSFGAGECLNGEVNGVFQDVLVEYTMTVSVCKGL